MGELEDLISGFCVSYIVYGIQYVKEVDKVGVPNKTFTYSKCSLRRFRKVKQRNSIEKIYFKNTNVEIFCLKNNY